MPNTESLKISSDLMENTIIIVLSIVCILSNRKFKKEKETEENSNVVIFEKYTLYTKDDINYPKKKFFIKFKNKRKIKI
jgi:hypothetical protein